jgi:hypothetical protein
MSPESADAIPVVVRPTQVEQAAALEAAPAGVEMPTVSAEQAQAVDVVFAQKREEPPAAAAFLGLWSAGMLAHDLLADHLAREEKAEEEREPAEPEA